MLHPTGAFSYIEQPPHGGVKIALLLWFVVAETEERKIEFFPHGQILELSAGGLVYLIQTVRFFDEEPECDAGNETHRAFDLHVEQFRKRGMSLRDNCLRTWIYVRDVD